MADRPVDILQRTRNLVDTAESGWLGWAEDCTQAYDAAYGLHSGALTSVKETLKGDADRIWQVFNILLGGFASAWVPRLLLPVKPSNLDELASGWVKDTLSESKKEVESLLKGTVLDKLKSAGNKTDDPFEPVVEKTLIYGSRLREGIVKRAFILKQGMDELIAAGSRWSESAALSLEFSFRAKCPFVRDVPTLSGDEFEKMFQKEAELGMWVAWALARPEQWWREAQGSNHVNKFLPAKYKRAAMAPALNRLLALGIPPDRVSSVEYMGSTIGGGRVRILDMVKLIEWAKSTPKPKGVPVSPRLEVCRVAQPGLFKPKAPSCPVPQSGMSYSHR